MPSRREGTDPPGSRRPGALVVGGDYRALGVVRSLGRRGIPVWVLRSPDDHRLAALSRHCRRRLLWPEGDQARLALLRDLAQAQGAQGWVLFPTADATAAFVARHSPALGRWYRLTTPPWEVFGWAYDKRRTAELAETLGVDQPRTRALRDRADAEGYSGPFPVALKPATKPFLNRPAAKAWRADDAAALLSRYDEAAAVTEPGTLVLQELVPGDRDAQFSFAALCQDGEPLASVTALRARQHPADFGRSSTFVETIENPEVGGLGRRVLKGLGLTGLAEVEFKRDCRDGTYRLLDINVRVWGWHTIGRRAGLDFPHLAWRQAVGEQVAVTHAPGGLRWLRLTTDLPVGLREVAAGRVRAVSYLRSVLGRHERPVLALDDPLPALLEVPLFALSRLHHR